MAKQIKAIPKEKIQGLSKEITKRRSKLKAKSISVSDKKKLRSEIKQFEKMKQQAVSHNKLITDFEEKIIKSSSLFQGMYDWFTKGTTAERGLRNKKGNYDLDKKRVAKQPIGKRTSKNGKVYYERRPENIDISKKKRV